MSATVTIYGIFDMQVCVPQAWTDEQVIAFANHENPAGTASGWIIRRQGDEYLSGTDERVRCESQCDHVHIMLDC